LLRNGLKAQKALFLILGEGAGNWYKTRTLLSTYQNLPIFGSSAVLYDGIELLWNMTC
jgi:hypothetical protein